MLDALIPAPRKVEINHVDLDAPANAVWEHLRHRDLADSVFVRALFAVRTLPSRLVGRPGNETIVRIDDLRSTPEQPGFQLLAEAAPHSVTVGAIGKVWQLDIPFLHVDGPAEYTAVSEPGWIKVAWELRVQPRGDASTRVSIEVRVDATDTESWQKFERYWRLIGPGSHWIRHMLFAGLRRRFGAEGSREEERVLASDALISEAGAQATHGITIHATPEAIWPWLVQMGCGRGGFYSIDALDNGGVPSARVIHPEFQAISVGQVISAAPGEPGGFEVLTIEPERALVLGGLFNVVEDEQLPFRSPRPERYWQVTWAFHLERLDETSTRLHVRARAAFSPSEKLHVAGIRLAHTFMQVAQLRNLAARVEGRTACDAEPH